MIDAPARRNPPATADGSAAGENRVRVSLASLLSLHRGAESLALRSRKLHATAGSGHLSAFKGRGMEFDEVRPYAQGDDARSIDWRVTARSGEPHTKLFREERERAVLVWIDLRRPMFFGTRGAFKAVRAAQAAALIGWNTLDRGDRLGALIFDERHHEELRPRRGQPALLRVLRRLAGHPAWNGAEHRDGEASAAALDRALLRLRRVAQPGGLVALLSDFAEFDYGQAAHLDQLARHSDLILVAIHDPLEAELPPAGFYRVSDGRSFLGVETGDRERRERYRRRFAENRAELERLCRRRGAALVRLATADDPLAGLQRELGRRR